MGLPKGKVNDNSSAALSYTGLVHSLRSVEKNYCVVFDLQKVSGSVPHRKLMKKISGLLYRNFT